jgi:hypothetical protein
MSAWDATLAWLPGKIAATTAGNGPLHRRLLHGRWLLHMVACACMHAGQLSPVHHVLLLL